MRPGTPEKCGRPFSALTTTRVMALRPSASSVTAVTPGVTAVTAPLASTVATAGSALDGKHDNADFGDGFTPVTLRLPFAKAGRISLHTLTGDPRLTNRQEANIAIQSKEIPAGAVEKGVFSVNGETGGDKGGMPPGSIYLYVFAAGA
jgi:hypothetical protein